MEADGNITVRIRDDGRGMRGDVSDTSFGLIGMRERVAPVGNAQGRIPAGLGNTGGGDHPCASPRSGWSLSD
jgi:nitrate/nitrite-specific signal transduction histidine kinase